MIFNEDDIKFPELSGEDFEELCFDLLHRLIRQRQFFDNWPPSSS